MLGLLTRSFRNFSLLQDYKQLTNVIYKQKYFIPQRPFPPVSVQITGTSKDILQQLDRHYPELAKMKLKFKNQQEHKKELIRVYMDRFAMESSSYIKKISDYKLMYIFPLKMMSSPVLALGVYVQENQKELMKKLGEKKYTFQNMLKLFKSLPQKQKKIYEKKREELMKEKNQQLQDYSRKYKVPAYQKISPEQLYLSKLEKEPKTKEAKKYKKLSDKQKDLLAKECKKINQKRLMKYRQELQSKNVTSEQINRIKDVCKRMDHLIQKNTKYINRVLETVEREGRNELERDQIYFGIIQELAQQLEVQKQINQDKKRKQAQKLRLVSQKKTVIQQNQGSKQIIAQVVDQVQLQPNQKIQTTATSAPIQQNEQQYLNQDYEVIQLKRKISKIGKQQTKI